MKKPLDALCDQGFVLDETRGMGQVEVCIP
jgi:hypothetical protein